MLPDDDDDNDDDDERRELTVHRYTYGRRVLMTVYMSPRNCIEKPMNAATD